MVKVAWFLSICVLFVVLVLQFSDAVQYAFQCYSIKEDRRKVCESTSSCVVYTCKKDDFAGRLEKESDGSGCVEDFFNDAECAYAEAAFAKDFIKKQTFLDMNYYNGYVKYVSGCRTESDTRKCLHDKSDKFDKELEDLRHEKEEKWYSTADNSTVVVSNPSDGGSKSSDGGSNPSGGDNFSGGDYTDHFGPNGNQTSSSNQNGAFKFIGIIAFGWILFAASWI